MRTPCGPRNSPPYLAVSWEGSLGYCMPSKDSDRACKLQPIEHQMVATKFLLSWPLRPALKGAPMDVKIPFRDWHHAYYDRSHESYQGAVEIDRKIRIFYFLRWYVCDGHE